MARMTISNRRSHASSTNLTFSIYDIHLRMPDRYLGAAVHYTGFVCCLYSSQFNNINDPSGKERLRNLTTQKRYHGIPVLADVMLLLTRHHRGWRRKHA